MGGDVAQVKDAVRIEIRVVESHSQLLSEDTVRCVRNRFIRSAIGACILSLLGVGDRHLQNMVVSTETRT